MYSNLNVGALVGGVDFEQSVQLAIDNGFGGVGPDVSGQLAAAGANASSSALWSALLLPAALARPTVWCVLAAWWKVLANCCICLASAPIDAIAIRFSRLALAASSLIFDSSTCIFCMLDNSVFQASRTVSSTLAEPINWTASR